MQGFMNFIREQGVVGLAVGFILGGAVSQFVDDFVSGFITPIIDRIFGDEGLAEESFEILDITFQWGLVFDSAVYFVAIAAVVYFGVKKLGLDKMDKEKK